MIYFLTTIMTTMTSEWQQTLNSLPREGRTVVVIVGPRGAGKSTFARALLSLHPEAAFLDTDLGRPEFTIPGLVSITQHNNIRAAVYIGQDEPSARPNDYLDAIQKLSNLVGQEPFVIVNTHGWVSGLGEELLEMVLRKTKVTDVVQIVPEQKLATLGSLLRLKDDAFKIWTLKPATEIRNRESKTSRDARAAATFAGAPTYAVGMNRVHVHFPPDALDTHVPMPLLLSALNGSTVGMAQGSESDPSCFIGVGIVCGIDLEKHNLFIRTMVPIQDVKRCDTLIMGTSARVPLLELSKESKLEYDFENEKETTPWPYLTSAKLIGFGAVAQPKSGAPAKRRRLETAAAL